jgi:predicted nucleic acid-binding protein
MSGSCFVDTNVLIYAHDSADLAKHQRAQALVAELWESRCGVVSTQVLQELCVNLRRKLKRPMPVEEIRSLVADYMRWQVVANSAASILEALTIQAKHNISFWDALILQSAEAAGAEVLYSEDLSPGRRYGATRIVNPFSD